MLFLHFFFPKDIVVVVVPFWSLKVSPLFFFHEVLLVFLGSSSLADAAADGGSTWGTEI
ncbi:Uncharacterized protein TCM_011361 [Theobroma cacao]|uniref:Uncharacterized protein n=1 Tax=Theobroma cacao TaxID=3641 RepID=A0A061EAQ8_THECC|nr:Uncharacterized protein TCM_011361 [Theobroma cacao]